VEDSLIPPNELGPELKRDLQEAAQREKEQRIKIALITIIIGVIFLWLIL
jgi:hypothetical protein